jgi:replicative DNA helicase
MKIDADVEPMPEDPPGDQRDDLQDGDPLPLTAAVELPPFPVNSFPRHIAKMVCAVSEATQTDPAMAGTSAISALSACTGGLAEIEIRPGWREPLCTYSVTIAAPGERKSAVQLVMSRPILDVEARLAGDDEPDRLEALTRKQIASKAAERLRNIAAQPPKKDDDESTYDRQAAMADAIKADAFADEIEVPPITRILADDVTPEAAASLLAEQGGRIAILSSEGGIFDILAGRYSRSIPNLDLFLKAHSGDPVRVDRKGRAPEYIRRPALTLGLMVQPVVLTAIAANREFRGRGLLARFNYAFPVSRVGHRKIAPARVDPDVEENYEAALTELAEGMAEWQSDPAVLTLTPAAQKAIQEIEAAVEPTLAGEGELAALADWGAKHVGAIARFAGIVHLAEHGADAGPRHAVEAQTILAAYRIGKYFKACAINAFIQMRTDPVTADALYLLERIRYLGEDEVSERDLHTASSRARFHTKADLMPAVDRLVDHGYLIPMPPPKPTGGRPASQRYKVHEDATKATEATEGRQ